MRVPILTSPRVDMPTTTVTVTCTQREEVEAMRREDGKRFFGLWWKGPRGEQGAVGSLCEVTGIVSMQVPRMLTVPTRHPPRLHEKRPRL